MISEKAAPISAVILTAEDAEGRGGGPRSRGKNISLDCDKNLNAGYAGQPLPAEPQGYAEKGYNLGE